VRTGQGRQIYFSSVAGSLHINTTVL